MGRLGVGAGGRSTALIASGRVPSRHAALPARRPREPGLGLGRQPRRAPTLGLSSQDVAGARIDASTGRRDALRAAHGRRLAVADLRGRRRDRRAHEPRALRGDLRRRRASRRPDGHRHRHLSRVVRPAHPPAAGRRAAVGADRPGAHLRRGDAPRPHRPREPARWRAPSSSRSAIRPRSTPAPRSRSRPPCAGAWTPWASSTPAPTTPTSAATASTARWASRACNSARRCRARCSTSHLVAAATRGLGRGVARARRLPGAGVVSRATRLADALGREPSVRATCEHVFACPTSSSTATPPSPSWTAPRCPTSWWPPRWSAGTPRWPSPTTTRSRARWSSRRPRATWGACAPSTARR